MLAKHSSASFPSGLAREFDKRANEEARERERGKFSRARKDGDLRLKILNLLGTIVLERLLPLLEIVSSQTLSTLTERLCVPPVIDDERIERVTRQRVEWHLHVGVVKPVVTGVELDLHRNEVVVVRNEKKIRRILYSSLSEATDASNRSNLL